MLPSVNDILAAGTTISLENLLRIQGYKQAFVAACAP
jgi:hypothetical protein